MMCLRWMLFGVLGLVMVMAMAGCQTTREIAEATTSFTRDVVDTVTFQKTAEPETTPPTAAVSAAPEPATPKEPAQKQPSISISYTLSGGLTGRILEQWAIHTPDYQPQTALALDYVVDVSAAPKLLDVLRKHGFFSWNSLASPGTDQYTAHLQVIVDGEPTSVTMYGAQTNPMSDLLRDLRQTTRDHYVSRLAKAGLCAHRGASKTHPENTLAAFREAIRLGAAMIEFDVIRTADGRLVLMHDATVDRTTSGKGRVSELTFAEIRALDAGSWKDARFAGEKVPTLAEALAMMPRDIWLNVHLKGDAELGAQALAEIARADRMHQAFLAATREQAAAARAADPNVLVCNMSRQDKTSEYVADTIAMKAAFIQLSKRGGPFTAADIQQLQAAGVRINYFGTDDPAEAARLMQAGVQFVLTDDMSAAQSALNQPQAR